MFDSGTGASRGSGSGSGIRSAGVYECEVVMEAGDGTQCIGQGLDGSYIGRDLLRRCGDIASMRRIVFASLSLLVCVLRSGSGLGTLAKAGVTTFNGDAVGRCWVRTSVGGIADGLRCQCVAVSGGSCGAGNMYGIPHAKSRNGVLLSGNKRQMRSIGDCWNGILPGNCCLTIERSGARCCGGGTKSVEYGLADSEQVYCSGGRRSGSCCCGGLAVEAVVLMRCAAIVAILMY